MTASQSDVQPKRSMGRVMSWLQASGAVVLMLICVQLMTGLLLAFYYVPSVDHAHTTVSFIEKVVSSGSWIRSLHHYGSQWLPFFVFLHLIRLCGKNRAPTLYNRRDAWVFGAVDPNSGTSAMLEVARGFGELLKQGWKPRRTIILCSWDAEEYGLIGSTEWAEEFADDLREKAVAYLNLDAAVSGPEFGASSVPSLWKLLRATTRDIKDPKTGKTIYQQWQDRDREGRPEGEQHPREARI